MKSTTYDRLRWHNTKMKSLVKEVSKLKNNIADLQYELSLIEPDGINDWRSYKKIVSIEGELFKLKKRLVKRRKQLEKNVREEE